MATHSVVQVAPDSTGSFIDNVELTIDTVVVQRQVTVQGDPSDGEALASVVNAIPGTAAYGVVTREAPGNFDTDITAPGSGTLVAVAGVGSADPLRLDGIALTNSGLVSASVGVADGAGRYLVPSFELAAHTTVILPQHRRPVTGLQWLGDAGITVHIWGER